jgi:hypothetical protein
MKYNLKLMLLTMFFLCPTSQAIAQETSLKEEYSRLRKLVDSLAMNTKISKRPMTDAQWEKVKDVSRKIRNVGIAIVVILVLKNRLKYALAGTTSKAQKKVESTKLKPSIDKPINLKADLTDEVFDTLPILKKWEHVLLTGNWERLDNIIDKPYPKLIHALIRMAENHDKDIVPGLQRLLIRYPSKIDEFDDVNEITPIWTAMYKLQQNYDSNPEYANTLAKAITFLIDNNANVLTKEKVREGASTEGTLADAAQRVPLISPEVNQMKQKLGIKID